MSLGSEWHISDNGYSILNKQGKTKNDKALQIALDSDIKDICNPVLSNELSKERTSKIVLQIQKISNVSVPKANENSQVAPRLLKLTLTDGETYVQAVELLPLNSLSQTNTPPGTKILIDNVKIVSGYLLLTPGSFTLLGGKVPELIAKWELATSLNNTQRNKLTDGPPPWVNFGSKVENIGENTRFRSLGEKNKDEHKENSEFDLQRQEAIAEATSGAVKKVFGGRVKQNIEALRTTSKFGRKDTTKNKNKPNQKVREDDEKPEKPPEKVSLFSFLEDKLPVSDHNSGSQNVSMHISSSEHKFVRNPNNRYHQQINQQNKIQLPHTTHNRTINVGSHNENKKTQQVYQTKHVEVPVSNKQTENRSSNGNVPHSSSPVRNNVNIEDTTHLMTKMSINSQFASRSLRQHLNLTSPKHNHLQPTLQQSNNKWNVGDRCLAKYWEDGKFYEAEVVAVTDKTIAVKFMGYGNIEEVLSADCLPLAHRNTKTSDNNLGNGYKSRPYSGSMEFRRSSRNFY